MFVLVMTIVALAAPLVTGYDEIYDKLDVKKILSDPELLKGYILCFLDEGPCNQQYSKEFKELVPEVIADSCGKCTPIQKANTRKLFVVAQEKYPKEALELMKKYDPTGEHQTKFAAFLTGKDK